jgi:VIT1/CCC1 family predicted Fe2+/Mn2+ transporter
LSFFTGRTWWWSALRQLGVAVIAAVITYSIGRTVGISHVS